MKFDEYLLSEENPADLCQEIDELRAVVQELKEKNEELNDFSNSQVKKLLVKVSELEEKLKNEIAFNEESETIKKYKAQIKPLENRICELRRKNASLENKIKKMKCCGNCINYQIYDADKGYRECYYFFTKEKMCNDKYDKWEFGE